MRMMTSRFRNAVEAIDFFKVSSQLERIELVVKIVDWILIGR